jgi:hypothetical protein
MDFELRQTHVIKAWLPHYRVHSAQSLEIGAPTDSMRACGSLPTARRSGNVKEHFVDSIARDWRPTRYSASWLA